MIDKTQGEQNKQNEKIQIKRKRHEAFIFFEIETRVNER